MLQILFKKEKQEAQVEVSKNTNIILIIAGTLIPMTSGIAGRAIGLFMILLLDRLNYVLRTAVASNLFLSSFYCFFVPYPIFLQAYILPKPSQSGH